jgi:hypothetical protein
MRNRVVIALALACALVSSTPAEAPAGGGPSVAGKNAAFAADTGILLNDGLTGNSTLLTASLAKGKKKSVVAVEAAMQVEPGPTLPSLEVEVNGVPANGPVVAADCKNTGAARCPLAGSWWLDLDAAELANPGQFVGQPLTVELIGGTNTFAPPVTAMAQATMTVRLVKK